MIAFDGLLNWVKNVLRSQLRLRSDVIPPFCFQLNNSCMDIVHLRPVFFQLFELLRIPRIK